MSASAIKAGGVFVEIGADPRQFFAALNKVNKAMANMGKSLALAGAKVGGMGVATLAPFAAAVRQGAAYQSTLLNIQASTGATAEELEKLKSASMQMSAAMGKGPTEIAGSFLELLKAGMSVEQVLGGAGKAAIEFAAVGQMDVAQAAVVMADAMNVFGVDASKAANSISAAADASSTSIELMAQSFSQVSAVAALANQSIDTTSAALAILANAGVKGSDAGTSLKTMLMRLMAPADDAVAALGQLGLSVQSFRNADGTMKPLVEIIRTLTGALGNMDQATQDDIFRRIFGQDAIRAAAILTGAGVDGFNQMTQAMGGALSVGEKYKTLMSGLAGAGSQVMAAMERFAIAISDAVAPALMSVVTPLVGFINGLADLATNNKEAVANIAKFGVAAIAVGGALTGLGLSLQVASFGMGGIGKAAAIAIAPLRLLAVSATGISGAFASAVPGVVALASATGSAMVSAGTAVARFAAGMAAFVAGAVGGLATYIASTVAAAAASVTNAVKSGMAWAASGLPGVTAFVAGAVGGLAAYLGAAAAAVAGSVASAAAVAAAWVAPLAPFLAISAAIAGVGALLYSLRGQIGSAFSGVSELVGQASEAIGGGFNKAASDGMAVLSDLATTATTTFNGIYEAISAGDLSGAMDVLWAGLQAGWLRGVEAIMGYVDSWVSTFQDTFTYLGTTIAQTWDGLWTGVSNSFNTFGAYLQGAFDNVINTVLKSWDVMEAAVRKSWNYVMSFIKKGYDLKKENEKVDSEMTARARQRELQRPGIAGREAKAQEENKKRSAESQQRQAAMEAEAAGVYQSRSDKNAENAAARRSATKAAENDLNTKVASQRETRTRNAQAEDLGSRIQSATSVDQLRDLNGELRALADNSRLTAEQEKKLSDALDDQTEKIVRQANETPTANQVVVMNNADAAGREASRSKAEAVGTFSSFALGGLGYGSSLAQMQLDELRKIEKNTKNREVGIVRD